MKRMIVAAASSGALVAGVLVTNTGGDAGGTTTAPVDPENASEFCTENSNLGIGSHGACVAMLASSDPSAPISDFCKGAKVQAIFQTGNHGECVKAISAALELP